MTGNGGRTPGAVAYITGSEEHPRLHGRVEFYEDADGVVVAVNIMGLPENGSGFFGFHIHGGGNCGGGNFVNTESHYSRDGEMHPMHSGDLPPVLSAGGIGKYSVLTDRFSLNEILGKTVVIHGAADDMRSQPSGNSGEKIGCGIIRPVAVPYN